MTFVGIYTLGHIRSRIAIMVTSSNGLSNDSGMYISKKALLLTNLYLAIMNKSTVKDEHNSLFGNFGPTL